MPLPARPPAPCLPLRSRRASGPSADLEGKSDERRNLCPSHLGWRPRARHPHDAHPHHPSCVRPQGPSSLVLSKASVAVSACWFFNQITLENQFHTTLERALNTKYLISNKQPLACSRSTRPRAMSRRVPRRNGPTLSSLRAPRRPPPREGLMKDNASGRCARREASLWLTALPVSIALEEFLKLKSQELTCSLRGE